jgi:type IV pilus assembly protein PilA
MLKKRGFTLIELMIVLAVIAILAVVIVPKAGIFKNNARNAGVTTNVNMVRGYLESKTGASFINDQDKLIAALKEAFPTGTEDELNNPLSDSNVIGKDYSTSKQPAIYVVKTTAPAASADLEGSVIIVLNTDNYVIYGLDNTQVEVGKATIK